MLTGRPGRFGSTPSLLVGIGGYTSTITMSKPAHSNKKMAKTYSFSYFILPCAHRHYVNSTTAVRLLLVFSWRWSAFGLSNGLCVCNIDVLWLTSKWIHLVFDVRVTTDGTNLVLDESPDLPMERQISPPEVGCWTWKIFDWLTFMLLLNIYGLKFSLLFSHGWPYQQLFSLPHM